MSRLLLTVEDSFDLSGRGTAITPFISPDLLGLSEQGHKAEHGYKAEVRLARPDETEEITEATFYWEHFNPGGLHYICFLENGTKERVPPGTKIWLLDSPG